MDTSNDVDALFARANTLGLEEGPTPATGQAIAAAVAAARRLLTRHPSRDNRLRLSRALWREASMATTVGSDAATAVVEETVELVRAVLRESSAAEADFDAIVAECATHLADLASMFASMGDLATGEQVLHEAQDAGELSDGPATRAARVTIVRITFKFALQDTAERIERHEYDEADSVDLLRNGQRIVALLWDVADAEQPTTLLDLADGLQDLGRAHLVARQYQPAANAFAEAYGIYSCFDGPSSRQAVEFILGALRRIGEVPGVEVVVPMPGTWRLAARRARPRLY